MAFKLKSPYKPSGDQPQAIRALTQGLNSGRPDQVLLGVTGSGKTFTIANVIANTNRPALVIAHNKTLAAQLCAEFQEFFPDNAVEYFISYYDYYQPEAYVPSRDVYIEKEADINADIERLRHSATRSLLTRKDVIVVASVSCIYGLGSPDDYLEGVTQLKIGQTIKRTHLLERFEQIQYERNDVEMKRGRYRVKGDVIDIFPAWDEAMIRLDFFGDELDRIETVHPVTGDILDSISEIAIFPATHYVVLDRLDRAIRDIRDELKGRLKVLKREGKDLEAHRLEQRTRYDIEMMMEMGYCKGIENYSLHISGREYGSPPGVLLDFFPEDFITIIDESHVTVPQIGGMNKGDFSRKQALVDYGFRLPSAIDNRPLKFDEFEDKIGQVIYVSATPGPYELEKCRVNSPDLAKNRSALVSPMWADYDITEQIIRPTGLLDPVVEIRPTLHQIDDLMGEIQEVSKKGFRSLVTTLTKKMSEDLTDFLEDKRIKVRYLHSDIDALERIDILHDLRAGKFDVLVGVNLLREGLDLPEVALVAILDADKEGFLRNERSLIQTMGRAARNSDGKVVLYADKMTESMQKAVSETARRREIQAEFNQQHGITPQTVIKAVKDIRSGEREAVKQLIQQKENIEPKALPKLIKTLKKQMQEAAARLEFEVAAVLRDEIERLESEQE